MPQSIGLGLGGPHQENPRSRPSLESWQEWAPNASEGPQTDREARFPEDAEARETLPEGNTTGHRSCLSSHAGSTAISYVTLDVDGGYSQASSGFDQEMLVNNFDVTPSAALPLPKSAVMGMALMAGLVGFRAVKRRAAVAH